MKWWLEEQYNESIKQRVVLWKISNFQTRREKTKINKIRDENRYQWNLKDH
jgi:hypothetical protein